jgi:hypothetical protein
MGRHKKGEQYPLSDLERRWIEEVKRTYIPTPEQPALCRGCAWGRWDGLKQYCSRLQCTRKHT